jgi:hypothetical protein
MECTNHNITRYYQGGRWRCAVIINYGGINIYNTLTSSYADCGYQRNWWKVGLCHCLQLLLQMSLVAASIHIIRSHPHIQIYIYIYIYIYIHNGIVAGRVGRACRVQVTHAYYTFMHHEKKNAVSSQCWRTAAGRHSRRARELSPHIYVALVAAI